MNVTVRVDSEGVRRALAGLSEATSRTAIIRSLNRAVDAGKTEAVRVTRDELALKAASVREAIRIRKGSTSLLSAAIIIDPKPVPLIDYSARQTQKGVTVRVKKSGGRGLVRGAFIATMRSGHTGVFSRTSKTGVVSKRLPIRELFSTSVRQFFKRASAVKRVTTRAAEAFTSTALNQVKQALARAKAA